MIASIADLRLALRGLRRNPLFAIVAILSLALGLAVWPPGWSFDPRVYHPTAHACAVGAPACVAGRGPAA